MGFKLSDIPHLTKSATPKQRAKVNASVGGKTRQPSRFCTFGATQACIRVPIKVVNPTNARQNWRVRAAQVSRERDAVGFCFRNSTVPTLPIVVMLIRVAPRKLDAHDNLPASLKSVADEVASIYGVDDRDPRIKWEYDQEKSAEYGVKILITKARVTK